MTFSPKNNPLLTCHGEGLTHDRPLSIQYKKLNDQAKRPDLAAHGHEFYEFTFVCGGSCTHHFQNGSITLDRGDVIVALPGGAHAFDGLDDLRINTVRVLPAWLLEVLKPLWSETGLIRFLLAERLFPLEFHWGVLHLEATLPEIDILEKELIDLRSNQQSDEPSLAMCIGSLMKILSTLNHSFEREDEGACLPMKPAIWQAALEVEQAVTRGDVLDVGQLAASLDLSKDHFTRLFREAVGSSPRDYYQQRRIQHATRMLLEDPDSITDIALRLGFSDTAHFSRIFKRIKGISPTTFRQKHAPAKARQVE